MPLSKPRTIRQKLLRWYNQNRRDLPYPALDGNARRVLTRLFNIKREKDLRETGKHLVSPSRPGHFNQALMELGSRICLARHPGCPICPIAQFCAAKRSGCFAGKKPGKSFFPVKRKMQKVEWLLVVIRHKREILLRRRPSGGLLSGLWEVPGGERKKGETLRT